MRKLFLAIVMLSMPSSIFVEASDLWFFQLSGPVKSIVLEGVETIHADFDRQGRITYMRYGKYRAVIHRDESGRIDSITANGKRVDDFSTTKYRQRATDERGNWIARKTQRSPYIITTEYCTTIYY